MPLFSSQKLTKQERLNKKKWIAELFIKGKRKRFEGLLIRYLPIEGLWQHQVLFSIPKKQVRKAVDRQLIKRQMREAYRRNKPLCSEGSTHYLLACIYLGLPHFSRKARYHHFSYAFKALFSELNPKKKSSL